MKFTSLSLTIVFFSIFFQHSQVINSQELSAIEIIQKADEKVRGKTNHTKMEMEIVRPTWKRNISMKSWGRSLDFSMTYITAPAKDKDRQ